MKKTIDRICYAVASPTLIFVSVINVQRWLGLNATLHETQCYRIIAEDYRKQEKTGMAVALMRVAQGKLLQTKPPGSG
jgi:hypothetical protein